MPRKPPIPMALGEVESESISSLSPKESGVLLASSRGPSGGATVGRGGMTGKDIVGSVAIEKPDS